MNLSRLSDCVMHEAITPIDVMPLCSNEGFPYLVIEFFKKNIRDMPSDNELRIDAKTKNSWENKKLEEVYDHSSERYTVSSIEISDDDNRVHCRRWEFIREIVVIPPLPLADIFL
jgi:hypothetical protein